MAQEKEQRLLQSPFVIKKCKQYESVFNTLRSVNEQSHSILDPNDTALYEISQSLQCYYVDNRLKIGIVDDEDKLCQTDVFTLGPKIEDIEKRYNRSFKDILKGGWDVNPSTWAAKELHDNAHDVRKQITIIDDFTILSKYGDLSKSPHYSGPYYLPGY
jgi:hypothetical protein